MEYEFNLMRPRQATLHTARLRLREVVVSELLDMEKKIVKEALKLADAEVDVIAFGCTSGSLIRGLGHDREIVLRIEKATSTPAVATAGAVVNALRALNLLRISVVTPYTDEINILERKFLEQNGFAVVKIEGLGITDNLEIGRQKSETVCRMAELVDTRRSEGIFLSCTNLPTVEVIASLEEKLGKPVVSSNTATMWFMLKRIGYEHRVEGYGSLFYMP
jgi:maleate isomerase